MRKTALIYRERGICERKRVLSWTLSTDISGRMKDLRRDPDTNLSTGHDKSSNRQPKHNEKGGEIFEICAGRVSLRDLAGGGERINDTRN